MTVRVELDHAADAFSEGWRIDRLLREELRLFLDPACVEQCVMVSSLDEWVLRFASDAFFITAWEVVTRPRVGRRVHVQRPAPDVSAAPLVEHWELASRLLRQRAAIGVVLDSVRGLRDPPPPPSAPLVLETVVCGVSGDGPRRSGAHGGLLRWLNLRKDD